MKKLLIISTILIISFFLTSCEKKDEGPTGPDIQFMLEPQLGKTYYFIEYSLDALNRRTNDFHIYAEGCISKNVSIGGVNDAFVSARYSTDYYNITYLRVVNGKDIYEYVDTANFFEGSSYIKSNLKNALQKLAQNYVWLPRLLLSKGNNAEYVILPKRFYTMQVGNGVFRHLSFEIKGKNEGFENVTVPAGNFKAYKVKVSAIVEAFENNKKVDSVEMIQYIWINDDIDWWVKQYQPTVISSLFGVIELGREIELTSVQ
ncbi:MAG: hypothetical protein NUV92_04100 [Ignavibacteria bacterium]|jgi:predicted small secreted protein|nr:hypothetical protein [Ignavibacteria bacterium]MDH7526685.1 hypothetical protein [Ignavibacteria bacterium]